MKYLWPQEVKFKFQSNGEVVGDLVVFFVLLNEIKNYFPVGSFKTDRCGEIVITKDQLMKSIEEAKSEFPMDYNGNLSDCVGIKVLVESNEKLGQRMEVLNKFYPEDAGNLLNLLSSSSNNSYCDFEGEFCQPFKNEIIKVNITEV